MKLFYIVSNISNDSWQMITQQFPHITIIYIHIIHMSVLYTLTLMHASPSPSNIFLNSHPFILKIILLTEKQAKGDNA